MATKDVSVALTQAHGGCWANAADHTRSVTAPTAVVETSSTTQARLGSTPQCLHGFAPTTIYELPWEKCRYPPPQQSAIS